MKLEFEKAALLCDEEGNINLPCPKCGTKESLVMINKIESDTSPLTNLMLSDVKCKNCKAVISMKSLLNVNE